MRLFFYLLHSRKEKREILPLLNFSASLLNEVRRAKLFFTHFLDAVPLINIFFHRKEESDEESQEPVPQYLGVGAGDLNIHLKSLKRQAPII